MLHSSFAQLAGLPRRKHFQGRSLKRALAISDLRARSLRRLPRVIAEYLEGGAEDETTLANNRNAFDTFTFRPRVLRDVSSINTGSNLFNAPCPLPFGIAPTGFNGLFWHEGDQALARAAAKAGIPFAQSTVSNASIAQIAQQNLQRHWFQLYLYGSDDVWKTLVDEAGRQGCEAILLTVDTAVLGGREWDRRNYVAGFTPSMSTRIEALRHPEWLWQVARRGLPSFPNLADFVPGQDKGLHAVAGWSLANQRPGADWSTVAEIRKAWHGKLIIKGIQHIDDLRTAIDAGADGVVLSNHGGRQLDRSASPVHLVKSARGVADKDFTILVDSGFRRGAEIVQALALGADAVLLGRAFLYGLAAAGEDGVTRVIEILASELQRTMALLGVAKISELKPELLQRNPLLPGDPEEP